VRAFTGMSCTVMSEISKEGAFCLNIRLMLPSLQAQETFAYPSSCLYNLAPGSDTTISLQFHTAQLCRYNINTTTTTNKNHQQTTPCNPSSSPAHKPASSAQFVPCLLNRGQRALVIAFDKTTYAGNLGSVRFLEATHQLTFVKGDICDEELVRRRHWRNKAVVTKSATFAAECTYDPIDPWLRPFLGQRVGTQVALLDVLVQRRFEKFLSSPREVYGTLPKTTRNQNHPKRTRFANPTPLRARQMRGDCPSAPISQLTSPSSPRACSTKYGPDPLPRKNHPHLLSPT